MFIGHFAVSLAAKKPAPDVSLGTMILSASFIDLLWPLFLVLGLEHVRVAPGITAVTPLDFYDYPITHSLAGVLGWSFLVGGIYWIRRKNLTSAAVVGAGVFSHWVLDLLTHRPDLPLAPGFDFMVGLGLWDSLPATIAVEGGLFAAGVFIYSKATKPRNRTGSYSYWALVTFLLVVYFSNLFGPPPPDNNVLGYVGLAMWLFVPWGYWIDKNRLPREKNKSQESNLR